MIDLTLLPSAMAGLKGAIDITSALVKTNNIVDVNAKAIELQQIIIKLQQDIFSAQDSQRVANEEILSLKKVISDLKKVSGDMGRYKLCSPFTGSAVYGISKDDASKEPAHYLCANCFQAGKKSVLNPKANEKGFQDFVCPSCRAAISTGYRGVQAKFVEDIGKSA
jgi:hypothetical protein